MFSGNSSEYSVSTDESTQIGKLLGDVDLQAAPVFWQRAHVGAEEDIFAPAHSPGIVS